MKKIPVLLLFSLSIFCAAAQNEAYKGGSADGHSLTEQVTPLGNAAIFQPYFGGISDGYAHDSLINYAPATPALLFAPYTGSAADGYSADSVITFTQYASINMFSPYLGTLGDGYDIDSVITFNQHGYIPMYGPYAGGMADGWAGYPIFGITIVPINLYHLRGSRLIKNIC